MRSARWRAEYSQGSKKLSSPETFPFEGKTDYEIAKIVREVVNSPTETHPHSSWEDVLNYHKVIDGQEVIVGVKVDPATGFYRVNTVYPPEPENRKLIYIYGYPTAFEVFTRVDPAIA